MIHTNTNINATQTTPKGVPTVQDFVSKEINVWGFDYVEGLFNDGYEPTFDTSRQRWVWLQA